jgi:hypothetical protein
MVMIIIIMITIMFFFNCDYHHYYYYIYYCTLFSLWDTDDTMLSMRDDPTRYAMAKTTAAPKPKAAASKAAAALKPARSSVGIRKLCKSCPKIATEIG